MNGFTWLHIAKRGKKNLKKKYQLNCNASSPVIVSDCADVAL